MTKELENFNNILTIIAKNYNVTPEEILSRSQKHIYTVPRHIFRTCLYDNGLTYEKIAELTKCHHTTAIASITKINKEYKLNKPKIYAFYKVLKELVKPYKFPIDEIQLEGRAYICGKITGLNESDVEKKFRLATEYLQTNHDFVLNPYQYCKDLGLIKWTDCMRVLVSLLPTIDVIYVMNDYLDSNGALWEIAISDKLFNIPIVKLNM